MIDLDENDILDAGLTIFKHDKSRAHLNTKLTRFRRHFGSNPVVYARMCYDLQTTNDPHARIDKFNLNHFLMAVHFLKVYPTEEGLSGSFGVSERTARKWINIYLLKIQALKTAKIVWPYNDVVENPTFMLSVDGTHCRINEPSHATQPKDKAYFSHKHNHAGLSYEIALMPFESNVVWINGPFPAGTSDINIFRQELRQLIPPDKLVIADQGYRGEDVVVFASSYDTPEVRLFKSRARARHETFNKRLKVFKCLSEQFRHKKESHKVVFEVICVICQYQMENGSPLFHV